MTTSTTASHLTELGYLRTQHVAEETLIDILPSFTSKKLTFLSYTIGPFRPEYPITVPLWIALNLHSQGRCRIVPPVWLDESELSIVLEREKNDPNKFIEISFFYIEVGFLLLNHCRSDITSPNRIEELLRDIQDLRHTKIHSGLMGWNSTNSSTSIKLNGISSMEIQQIREMSNIILKNFYQLQKLQNNTFSNNYNLSQSQQQASSSSQLSSTQESREGNSASSARPLRRMRR